VPIDHHSHHSPVGAYASFTVGRIGQGGGFGLALGSKYDACGVTPILFLPDR